MQEFLQVLGIRLQGFLGFWGLAFGVLGFGVSGLRGLRFRI